MSLHDSFLKLKFDKRMKTWNLNQKLVTEKEIKENLENLKDMNENVEPMALFSDPPEATTDQQTPQTPQNNTGDTSISDVSATSPNVFSNTAGANIK